MSGRHRVPGSAPAGRVVALLDEMLGLLEPLARRARRLPRRVTVALLATGCVAGGATAFGVGVLLAVAWRAL